jgi:thioester reductase-like protein
MQRSYFLTGGTGALGSALLPLLLSEKEAKIWLLIRADDETHLQKRLDELFSYFSFPSDQVPGMRDRIVPLRGDVGKSHFDLSDSEYSSLTSAVTHVIHCAGVVRMNYPLEIARAHALEPAKNIVSFSRSARNCNLQKIEFVTTVGVLGTCPGTLSEAWCTTPRGFHNSYEQAKAETEEYLETELANDPLPLTIHRPSMIVGDSVSGKISSFQVFYHLCEFLSGRRSFGILPDFGTTRLDIIPANHVAEMLFWSAHSNTTSGRIINICSSREASLSLERLGVIVQEEFAQHGIQCPKIRTLNRQLFHRLISILAFFSAGKSKRALKAFPFFLEYLGKEQNFDNRTMRNERNDLYQTLVPEEYVRIIIRYYLRSVYGKKA